MPPVSGRAAGRRGRSGVGLRPSGSFSGGGARTRLDRGLPRVGSGGTAAGRRGDERYWGMSVIGWVRLLWLPRVDASLCESKCSFLSCFGGVLRLWNIWGVGGKGGVSTSLHLKIKRNPRTPEAGLKHRSSPQTKPTNRRSREEGLGVKELEAAQQPRGRPALAGSHVPPVLPVRSAGRSSVMKRSDAGDAFFKREFCYQM